MMIRLSEAGSEATEQEFSFDKLFECLNEEEQKCLNSYLNRIIETLEAELSEERPDPDFNHNFTGHHFNDQSRRHPYGPARGEYPNGGPFDPRFGMSRSQSDEKRGHGKRQASTQDKPDED